jgi:hypothetical protein
MILIPTSALFYVPWEFLFKITTECLQCSSLYYYVATSFVSLWSSRDSHDSSVSTASRVWSVRQRNVGSIPGTGKIFPFHQIVQTGNGTQRPSYLLGTGDSIHGSAAAEA